MMTRIVTEFGTPIRELAGALKEGGVIGLATDTTYALVSSLNSRDGVEHLRDMRHLPTSKPLALLLPDLAEISRYAYVDRIAYRIMKRCTPGCYTFILRATKEVPRMTLTKQRTVGIRVCGKKIINALCMALEAPLISASAVTDEDGYAETAEDVARHYPDLACVIDSGIVQTEASTILDLTGVQPVVLRSGSGAVEEALATF